MDYIKNLIGQKQSELDDLKIVQQRLYDEERKNAHEIREKEKMDKEQLRLDEIKQYKSMNYSNEQVISSYRYISNFKYGDSTFEGPEIATNDVPIRLLIQSGTYCCEDYGTEQFIINEDGSNISIDDVDISGWKIINVKWGFSSPIKKHSDVASILIETDHKPIQFDVWLDHNGCYPHYIYVQWRNQMDRQTLG